MLIKNYLWNILSVLFGAFLVQVHINSSEYLKTQLTRAVRPFISWIQRFELDSVFSNNHTLNRTITWSDWDETDRWSEIVCSLDNKSKVEPPSMIIDLNNESDLSQPQNAAKAEEAKLTLEHGKQISWWKELMTFEKNTAASQMDKPVIQMSVPREKCTWEERLGKDGRFFVIHQKNECLEGSISCAFCHVMNQLIPRNIKVTLGAVGRRVVEMMPWNDNLAVGMLFIWITCFLICGGILWHYHHLEKQWAKEAAMMRKKLGNQCIKEWTENARKAYEEGTEFWSEVKFDNPDRN